MHRGLLFSVSLVLLIFCSTGNSADEVITDTVATDTAYPVEEYSVDEYAIDEVATDTIAVEGEIPDATGITEEPTPDAAAAEPLIPPLKALILTSPGIYHNYEQQTKDLAHGIVARANVRFDVSLAEPDRWKSTDYSEGYDVLIYNICMADNEDAELIANMRRQTEVLGVPALIIHCTAHSFRNTELWWPLYGLKTKAHEPERALRQIQHGPHPILTGIPEDWVLPKDELYINLDFTGQSLLSTTGEDGKSHTTAWIDYQGLTPIFGTTLGHGEETMKNTVYQQLLANALLFVTGNLASDGQPVPGMGPVGDGMDIFDSFSAPEGVKFLGREGQDCAYRKLLIAAGPCYLGCILDPFEWGEETRACKQACGEDVPPSDELIKACSPGAL
ncbi:MAG: ThuA domain-containing protein [Halioglobus sp.]|nr:ThuA domain-containing protein [Halioglobus sp.]